MLVTFTPGSFPTLVLIVRPLMHLHALRWGSPPLCSLTLWFHLCKANAFTLYGFFVCLFLFVLILVDQSRWQRRETLSSPPLTLYVYRAVLTTRSKTLPGQASVWTWFPRAQVCHNASGEERLLFLFECYSVCATCFIAETVQWI